MATNTPIYSIAKQLDIESNRIISACKSLGIPAKGATKRLNHEELEKIKNYFAAGKNVSEEIVDITKKDFKTKSKTSKTKSITSKTNRENKIKYFPNRLVAKS